MGQIVPSDTETLTGAQELGTALTPNQRRLAELLELRARMQQSQAELTKYCEKIHVPCEEQYFTDVEHLASGTPSAELSAEYGESGCDQSEGSESGTGAGPDPPASESQRTFDMADITVNALERALQRLSPADGHG